MRPVASRSRHLSLCIFGWSTHSSSPLCNCYSSGGRGIEYLLRTRGTLTYFNSLNVIVTLAQPNTLSDTEDIIGLRLSSLTRYPSEDWRLTAFGISCTRFFGGMGGLESVYLYSEPRLIVSGTFTQFIARYMNVRPVAIRNVSALVIKLWARYRKFSKSLQLESS